MKYARVLALTPFFLLLSFSCNKQQNSASHKKNTSKKQTESLKLKKPITYCEKSFYCSYSNLVSNNAKKTVLKKRKSFLMSCEEALKHMPKELVTEYEKCVSVNCGDELRKCVLNAGKKVLLKDNENRISPSKTTKDSTKTDKPQIVKPKLPPVNLKNKGHFGLKSGTKYNGPTP